MNGNPFENCEVHQKGDGTWAIVSTYWELPCVSEKMAIRTCEIIHFAYKAGKEDLRKSLQGIIIGDLEGNYSE